MYNRLGHRFRSTLLVWQIVSSLHPGVAYFYVARLAVTCTPDVLATTYVSV